MEETSNYINIISFTEKGGTLAKRLNTYLLQSQQKDQADCECDRNLVKCINKCRASESYSSIRLSECAKESFEKKQGMIFIGAAGIAVRTIAPFLKDKLHDPFGNVCFLINFCCKDTSFHGLSKHLSSFLRIKIKKTVICVTFWLIFTQLEE